MSAPSQARERIRTARRARLRRVFLQGAREALVFPAWIVGLSMLGVGTLTNDIGVPFWMAVLSTPLIWAGPAQFVLFGGLAAGTSIVSVAIAVTLTSARLLPSGVTLLALLPRLRKRLLMRILVSHYVVVTTWVEGMRRLPQIHPRDRLAWMLGFSNACVIISTLATAIGFWLGGALPAALAAGLMFVTPLFFSIAVVAGARRAEDIVACILGAGLLFVVNPLVGPDFDLIVAGLGAGVIAYWVRRARS